MKKLLGMLLLVVMLIMLNGCKSLERFDRVKKDDSKQMSEVAIREIEESLTKEIANVYKEDGVEYKDDKVYFLYGPEYDYDPSTNVRYRGILYSKRLEEMNAVEGLEIGLVTKGIGGADLYNYAKQYEGIFKALEIENMVEKKAKEIFGEKTTLYNDWSMTPAKYKHLKSIIGKENLGWDDKNGAYKTVVNVYGEDLEKLNIDEYKQKTFELSKFIYNYMNYATSLQIFVRDKSYFDNLELVAASIYSPFIDKKEIQDILKKIDKKIPLNEKEEINLIKYFRKGMTYEEEGIFNKADYKCIICWFVEKEDMPISIIKNIDYWSELKNGVLVHRFRKDREQRGIK